MLTDGHQTPNRNEKENTNNQLTSDDSFYKELNTDFLNDFDSYDKKILFEKSTDDSEYLQELETKISNLDLKKATTESNSYLEKTLELLEKDYERESKLTTVLEEILNKLEKLNQ